MPGLDPSSPSASETLPDHSLSDVNLQKIDRLEKPRPIGGTGSIKLVYPIWV